MSDAVTGTGTHTRPKMNWSPSHAECNNNKQKNANKPTRQKSARKREKFVQNILYKFPGGRPSTRDGFLFSSFPFSTGLSFPPLPVLPNSPANIKCIRQKNQYCSSQLRCCENCTRDDRGCIRKRDYAHRSLHRVQGTHKQDVSELWYSQTDYVSICVTVYVFYWMLSQFGELI